MQDSAQKTCILHVSVTLKLYDDINAVLFWKWSNFSFSLRQKKADEW